jgi:cysteine desulfurase
MTSTVYLDNAATTALDPRVRDAMRPWFGEQFGNPSSRHRQGQRAQLAIEDARTSVARAVGAERAHVVFTSGGTEANNLGVLGSARARAKHGKHVLMGPTEHPCVRECAIGLRAEGFEVEWLRLTTGGAFDLDHLASRLRADTVLVAQMLVQNEVGSVYPLHEIARIAHARSPNAAVHVDAVQAFGKIELSIGELGADSLAISSHKVHGPQGAGALVMRTSSPLRPLFFGGGQERGLRSGTENVAGIVGFGRAAELAASEMDAVSAHLESLRDAFVEGLARIPGARVVEPGAAANESTAPSTKSSSAPSSGIRSSSARSSNFSSRARSTVAAIVAVIVKGAPSEVRMHHLEELGVVVSAGSACHSHKEEASPSMMAMGLSAEEARSMLRFSFSRATTREDVERGLEALESVCRKLASAGR